MEPKPPIGTDFIREYSKRVPTTAGVYRMIAENGDVLYVGKAKNLKNRIYSYASKGLLSVRIARMVEQTRNMEVVTTRSEAEALLLEASLIKRYKPRYNILLKDDKSYPYITLSMSHPFPRIVKYRGAQRKGDIYFGPFASAGAVNQTLAILQKAFLLRPCADTVFKNRTRPCLQYQIKRCSAPCVRLINEEDYAKLVALARDFFSGKSREVQALFSKEMQDASEQMKFETAARYRDRLRVLTQLQQTKGVDTSNFGDTDIIACYKEGDACCVQVFFFRGGQHYGNQAQFPAHTYEMSEEEILEAFIAQFYQNHPPPREILLSHLPAENELLEEALASLAGYKVCLRTAMRGVKKAQLDDAMRNAKSALALKIAERQSEHARLSEFAELFGLAEIPQRIEVYDNSHIMGTHAVGAMIVATPEGFDKKCYRRFNIRRTELTPGDDYAMLREVLSRRFVRLTKEDPDQTLGSWPGFMLIDGGLGHMGVVQDVLAEAGIQQPFACIAKGMDRNAGREWFFVPGREPFQLPEQTPVLFYLQRLRDEAHRFAISSHRIKRANAIRASTLDEIPGIGGTRKRALLNHFGSSKGVEAASLADLSAVPGINTATAQRIYDFFHGGEII